VHDPVAVAVVGHVQQRVDEGPVGAGHPLLHRRAVQAAQVAADDERALGARRHDDRVLDHLRLDQAEHLGAEVVATVGPTQATAGHGAEPQVHALDAR
jgi:hypothetical protein